LIVGKHHSIAGSQRPHAWEQAKPYHIQPFIS